LHLRLRHRRNVEDRRGVVVSLSGSDLLFLQALLHLVVELYVVVGGSNFVISLFTLQLVELVNVGDHHLDYSFNLAVVAQLPVRAHLGAANWANTFHISIVVLNAALAKLVQARPYDAGVLINARANLAEQGRVLDRLK